jgi:hypothetical protein
MCFTPDDLEKQAELVLLSGGQNHRTQSESIEANTGDPAIVGLASEAH